MTRKPTPNSKADRIYRAMQLVAHEGKDAAIAKGKAEGGGDDEAELIAHMIWTQKFEITEAN